jgi:uncharacterized GH25 family protein
VSPAPASRNALRGVVEDAAGAPVAGASVAAVSLEDAIGGDPKRVVPRLATSDNVGAFALPDLAAGAYAVSARAAAGAGDLPFVRVAATGETIVRVRLAPGASIEGRVVDDAGAPVVSARVVADASEPLRLLYHHVWTQGFASRSEVATIADAEGRFRLGPLAAGEYGVDASASTCPKRSTRLSAPSTGVTIVLRRGGALSGTVVLGHGSLPDEIRLWTEPWIEDRTLRPTGSETPFRWEGLPAGPRRVLATATGFTVASADVRVDVGAAAGPVRLECLVGTPVTGSLVAKGTSQPIVGAKVALSFVLRNAFGSSRRTEQEVETDANGRWSARLRPGEWMLKATKAGWGKPEGEEETVFEVKGEPLDRTDALVESPWVEGVVTFEDGTPAAGASVAIVSVSQNPARPSDGMIGLSADMRAETDAAGRFRIEGVVTYAAYSLEASTSNGTSARVDDVTFEAGSVAARTRITLSGGAAAGTRAEGDVEVRIVDEGGAPVVGALAQVGPRSATSDAQGRATFSRVPAGTHSAAYSAVGLPLALAPDVTVTTGETTRPPDWVLRKTGCRVSGRVTSSGGKAIEDASVSIWFHLPANRMLVDSTTTRADGRYALAGPAVEGSKITAQVRADSYEIGEAQATLEKDTVVDFVLKGWGKAVATVAFDGPSGPRVDASYDHVEFRSWWPADATYDAAHGTLEIGRVQAGRRRFRLTAPGYAPALFSDVEVREGETASLGQVTFRSGGTATGRVRDAAGRPVAGKQVSLSDLFLYVDTDAEGRFRIEHVTPGTWTFSIHALDGWEDRPSPTFSMTIEEGRTAETEQTLPK